MMNVRPTGRKTRFPLRRRIRTALTATIGLAAAMVVAGTPQLPEAVRQFHAVRDTWDADKLTDLHLQFERIARQNPNSVDAQYWLAASALHRVLFQLREHTRDKRQPPPDLAAIDSALDATSDLLALDSLHAEGHSMMATLLGMRISRRRLGALQHGRDFQHHFRMTAEHGSDNPRAQFLHASSILYGPAFLGGRDKALPHFEHAARLFQSEAENRRDNFPSVAPAWGAPDTWAHIGRIYLDRDNHQKAKSAFERALDLSPTETMAADGLKHLSKTAHDGAAR